MSYDYLEDLCEDFLFFHRILGDLHHYTKYDVDKIKKELHKCVKEIADESKEIVESDWFKVD